MPLKMADNYNRSVGAADIIPILGEQFRAYHEKFFDSKSIICSGFPRNEILYKLLESKEIFIVWLPTYRQHNTNKEYRINNCFPLGLPVIKSATDLRKIDETLRQYNVYLLIRMHPVQDKSIFTLGNSYQNIKIADDAFLMSHNIKLYELLAKSAGLITDYSSVYYDYLEVGRPIGLTLEDAEQYSKKWPLFFKDVQNELKGSKIKTVEDLRAFIIDTASGRDKCKAEREQLKKQLGIHKRDASEILYQNLIKKGVL
jgi:CDP-glycerol glycerophosphotransferase (TagB/SpsB family)